MSHSVHARDGRAMGALTIAVFGVIVCLLCIAVMLVALGLAFGLLPLPYPLFLVLQRLPIAFPLHMAASGLALVLIPIAAMSRHYSHIHRPVGRMAAVCVGVGGLTALAVALASEASIAARAGFYMQGLTWLGLLGLGLAAIRRRDRARHARHMIAMAAVASAALWLRLVMAAAGPMNWPFETTYAIAAWACWLVPLALVLAFALPVDLARGRPPAWTARAWAAKP
jgi:hypothetical protein